jgi:hypothetical protein
MTSRDPKAGFPPARAFLLVLLPPILPFVWGALNSASPTLLPFWRYSALIQCCGAVLALSCYIPIRYRKSPRAWTLVVSGIAGCLMVLAGWFLGTPSITNVVR